MASLQRCPWNCPIEALKHLFVMIYCDRAAIITTLLHIYHARIIITSSMASGVVASAHLLSIVIAKIFSVRSRKTTTSCLCSWSSSVSPPITGLQSETFSNTTAPDRLVQLCFFDLSPTSSAVATGTVLYCC